MECCLATKDQRNVLTRKIFKATYARGETTAAWWASAVSMAAVSMATVAGNAAVLTALRRLQRVPAHYPLASLAAADLLVGMFVQPLAAARELFVFHLHWTLCSCWSFLDVLCCTASILSICLLGWERWCGITNPLARAKRAERARLFSALVWPAATVVALPTAIIPSQKHYLPGEIAKACTVNTNVGYVFFSTFFSFYLPACLMLVMYVRILHCLAVPPPIRAHRGRSHCMEAKDAEDVPRNSSSFRDKIHKVTIFLSPKGKHLNLPGTAGPTKREPALKNSSSPGSIHSRQRRATRTIVMLMSLFLVCWTPFFVMLPLDSLCECVWDVVWQWCTWLGYVNSALNPIVYAAASPSVRRALHASFSTSSTRTTDIPLTPSVRRP